MHDAIRHRMSFCRDRVVHACVTKTIWYANAKCGGRDMSVRAHAWRPDMTVHPFILSRAAWLRTSSPQQHLFLRLVPWELSCNHTHWGRAGGRAGARVTWAVERNVNLCKTMKRSKRKLLLKFLINLFLRRRVITSNSSTLKCRPKSSTSNWQCGAPNCLNSAITPG